ncbi:MAG: hypothetical protein V4547_17135 [Bacteroidota bacterium]
MGYSSIIAKKCKCGCDNFPTMSYEGYYMSHAPQEVLDRLDRKHKRKKAITKAVSKLSNDQYAEGNYDEAERQYLINDLDFVHSRLVRMMAADKSGIAACFTCGKLQHWTLMQLSHFIKRSNTLTRWDNKANRCCCKHCNETLDGNLEVFASKLNEEENGLAEQLTELSREPYKWGRDELKQLLIASREKLRIIEQKFNTQTK